ncbi:MAG: hypothetical protein Q7S43_00655 [bacterium]|nr:hypothetical protein [bacterium]
MSDKDIEARALPAGVFVPEHTMKMIVNRVAKLSEGRREKEIVVLVRSGRYRASTDQVILYQHESRLPPPKADLIGVTICKVSEILSDVRKQMGSVEDNDQFLMFIRKYWDESLELDSPVTLLTCNNLRGELLEMFIEINRFHSTLPEFSQE